MIEIVKPHHVVLPGDEVLRPEQDDEGQQAVIRLGSGLALDSDGVVRATQAGILQKSKKDRFYHVTARIRRYAARTDDIVVGTVVRREGDWYRVDIGACRAAMLPVLGFERATKKTCPRLERGDVLLCRVVTAEEGMAAHLLCVTERDRAEGLGQLSGGFVLHVSLAHATRLAGSSVRFLRRLGASVAFSMSAGANGRVHIDAVTAQRTALVASAILNAEHLDEPEAEAMVRQLLKRKREMF